MSESPAGPPPAVAPGPPLSAERLARFGRQLLMPGFDEIAQRRLAAARVLVVGGGGLGSAGIPYLAAAGVGTIGVVDDDEVELTNLHRQVIHSLADVGRPKVDSVAEAVAAIDPEVVVRRHRLHLDATNALDLLAEYDVVVDGSDNYPTRYLTNDAAVLCGKPLVWGAILRYSGQASVAWAGYGPTYRDLFPDPPAPEDVLACSDGGVLPSVCAVIGSILASETVKVITGIGEPLLGRLTTYDALTGRFRELEYEAIPDAEPVRGLVDYERFCGLDGPAKAAETADGVISAAELSRRIADGEPLQVIDVREPFEAQIARIGGSELIPLGALPASLERVRQDRPVVVYCHHDARSARAAALLRASGIRDVAYLAGGIDEYAATAEPALARY